MEKAKEAHERQQPGVPRVQSTDDPEAEDKLSFYESGLESARVPDFWRKDDRLRPQRIGIPGAGHQEQNAQDHKHRPWRQEPAFGVFHEDAPFGFGTGLVTAGYASSRNSFILANHFLTFGLGIPDR